MRTLYFICFFISSLHISVAQNTTSIKASQQEGCAPLSITFSTTLKGVVKYKWEFSNGITSTNDEPTILFEQPGNYDVKLLVEFSDNQTETFSLPDFIKVNEVPKVNFSTSGDIFCDGDSIHFINESIGASTFIWDFGDGTNTTKANPTHAYTEKGSYAVTLMAYTENGCSNIKHDEDRIQVNKIVGLDFSGDAITTCTNDPTINFSANQEFESYHWDFGDGYSSIERSPGHDFLKAGKYSISLQVKDKNGCRSEITKKDYITSHIPSVAKIEFSSSVVCQNEPVEFINKTPHTKEMRWQFENGSVFTDNKFSYTFPSADTVDLTVYIKDKNGCEQTVSYPGKIVVIEAEEVIIDISSNAGCAPIEVNFTNLTRDAISYKWEIGNKVYNGKTLNMTFTEPGPVSVTAFTSHDGGCTTAKVLDTAVMVNKSKVYARASRYSGCLPLETSFALSTTDVQDIFWDFGDGDTSASATPEKVYSKPGRYQVQVTFTNEFGCRESTLVERWIDVYDTFVDYTIPEPLQICLFEEVKFSGIAGKSDWKWDFGDGSYANEKNPVHQYKNPGTFTVSVEAVNANGCPVKIDNYVVVNVVGGQPTDFDYSINQCIDRMVEFRSEGPESFEYQWDLDDGNIYTGKVIEHDFERSGYYPVKLTTIDSLGCKMIQLRNEYIQYDPCLNITYLDGEDSSVLIIHQPEIRVTNPGIMQICSAPFQIDFQNPLYTASSWLWIFNDGSTSTEKNPTHEFSHPGTYEIDLIAYYDDGQIDSIISFSKIEVMDQKVDFSFDTKAVCDGYQVDFQDQSAMPVSWFWNFGDGTVSELPNPQKMYDLEGQYQVSLITTDAWGCTKRTVHNVSIGNPYYYFEVPENVCAGDSFLIQHNIEGFNTYTWEFGDGTFNNERYPKHAFSESGSFSVQLAAESEGNCRKVFLSPQQILSSKPTAKFEIEGKTTGCGTLSVRFKNLSTNATHWKWDFGNGIISTERDPVIDFKKGIFTVTLIAYNGNCADVFTQENVIVVSQPVADYTFVQDNICFPVTIAFKDESIDVSKWSWDFGNGVTSKEQNPVHIFYDMPKKKISLTVENSSGCKSTVTKESPVFHQTQFDAKKSSGCIPFIVSFIDKTIEATGWYWDFGDGNFSYEKSPTHTYEEVGIYNVSLITTSANGCTDTLEIEDFIKVGMLNTDFTMDVPPSLCAPLFTQFRSNAIGADTYTWDFGDGATSTLPDPIHIYTKVGEFHVSLITKNEYGCSDTVTIHNLARILGPEADFSLSDTILCHPQELKITDKSKSAIRWEWFFGDGTVSYEQHPAYEYEEPGDYTLSLLATDKYGCREFKKMDSIKVVRTPRAKFSVNEIEHCYPARIKVSNETENVQNVSFQWDFGNGQFSDEPAPEIYYQTPGAYKIKLTSINEMACADQYELTELIQVRDTFHLKEAHINELTVLRQNQIHINLGEYQRNNFNYYVVYRKSPTENEFNVIDTIRDKSQTSYSDFNVFTDFMDYSYKFQAHVYCNNPIPLKDINTYKSVLLHVAPKDSSMELKWSSYKGHHFQSYSVFRVEDGGTWEEIAIVPPEQNFYTDKEALCPLGHNYKVVANNLDGLAYYSMSNSPQVKPLHNLFLDQQAEIVRTTVVDNKGVLTEWKDPTIGLERVRAFRIWKSENESDFMLLNELPKGVHSFFDTDVSVSSNHYIYKVSVENTCNVEGKPSNLGSPILLRKDTDHYANYLYWTPYAEWYEGVGEYLLQKKNRSGEWETIERFDPDLHNFTIDLSDD